MGWRKHPSCRLTLLVVSHPAGEQASQLVMQRGPASEGGHAVWNGPGGWDAAAPFAVGGGGGLMYALMLQQGVDSIPGGSLAPHHPALRRAQALLGSTPLRMCFVALLGLGSVWALQAAGPPGAAPQDPLEPHNVLQMRQVRASCAGQAGACATGALAKRLPACVPAWVQCSDMRCGCRSGVPGVIL